jgi:predicted transcriptional regulator
MAKTSLTVNLEPEQLKMLEEVQEHTGIDNQQVHIRLAIRQYLAREHDKISELEFQKIRQKINKNHFARSK